jgi:hypothetical protein
MKDRDIIAVIVIIFLIFLGFVVFAAFKYRQLLANAMGRGSKRTAVDSRSGSEL